MQDKNLRYIENIKKRVGRTLYNYKLIQSGDNVLIGLSGGKDSIVLIEILAQLIKHLPFPCNLMAVHIQADVLGYEIDIDFLKSVCKNLNVPLYLRKIEIDFSKNKKKSPCFICSWLRRKELFKLTKELNCNKLALGHHMDDAIETLLLNMIYHGSVSSLPEKLTMLDGRIDIIRPLLHLTNGEILKYAQIRKFKQETKLCIYSNSNKRDEVKKIINDIQHLHDKAKVNIFRSMYNAFPEYLPSDPKKI